MFKKLFTLFNNRIVQNASWIVFGRLLQLLISFFVGILTTRYLGPSNYGLVSYGATFSSFFNIFCTLGINSVIVKEFIDRPQSEGEILGTAIGLRIVASLLSVGTIICISCFLDRGQPETQLIVALCSFSLFFNVLETMTYWFQAKLLSKKTVIATLIAYSISSAYKICLLIFEKPVIFFALSSTVDHLFYGAVLLFFYFCANGQRLSFSWSYGKKLLAKSCHFILSFLMVSIYAKSDKIMLTKMINEAETGFYTTASSISTIWCFILVAIITSLTPSIMQAHKEDKTRYVFLNKLLYSIIFYLSTFVSIIFTVLGDWIIVFLFGEVYAPAATPLKILTWQISFSQLGAARDTWVVCENKQKYLKYIYITAAFANVLLNLIFIPIWGASGAAFASLMAQIVTVMVAPFFIKDMRENSIMMLDAILLRGLDLRQVLRYFKKEA